MKRVITLPVVAALAISLVPVPQAFAYHVDPSYHRERTALAVVHPDGRVSMSAQGEEPRAALSLSKLYLGYWVLYNGDEEDREDVEEMVRVSDDAIAVRLDRKYPEAIDEIADDFNLEDTTRNGYWGRTATSARDVATFIAEILWDPRAEPLLDGMRGVEDVASDGFMQRFGTDRLEHAEGTKTGWSDDRTGATASVSYGTIGEDVWVAAALTNGSAYQNTLDTRLGINQVDDSPKDSEGN